MLERVFQGELNLPIVCGSIGDAGASGLIDRIAGQTEIGMVQDVEKLGAELEVLSFT